ncbi:MAG: penicillin-binding transpeptidase domain-containing protein [Acidimicrobiales bacterium]
MGRRIRWLGLVMVLCLGAVVAQLVNIQDVKAPALQASPNNPGNIANAADNRRGAIYADDGTTVLATSVKVQGGSYDYTREYPGGSLYSQVVGFDSTYEGTAGVEYEYNNVLRIQKHPAQNLSQALGLSPTPRSTDSVILTIDPKLQQAARTALSHLTGTNTDAAIVAIVPKTGAVVADYSTPTFDPAPLEAPNTVAGTAEQKLAALAYFDTKDHEGFYPGLPLATGETFFPGSTFKVVTASAVYNLDPGLSTFDFPFAGSTTFPNSDKVMTNDGGQGCGGTMADDMFATSCDPGFGQLGVKLTAPTLVEQAQLFGYNSRPPIDLPDAWVATPSIPAASTLTPPNQEQLADTAIGQLSDQASALSNAMVAAGIADGGTIMTPHVMSEIIDDQGGVVSTYKPTPWRQAVSPGAAAQVTALMKTVATDPLGTAAGVGFPADLDVAVKTGTAQTGNPQANTDDWMIGFAPADDPQIAIAVVVPLQHQSDNGAGVAGPIMKAMFEAALPSQS